MENVVPAPSSLSQNIAPPWQALAKLDAIQQITGTPCADVAELEVAVRAVARGET